MRSGTEHSAPDRLLPEVVHAGLRTRWLARPLHWLEETDSTNRVAQELARQGAAAGTTVVAEGQTAGRGRLGRAFFSPPFENLYTSIVLRPGTSAAEAPALALAAAVAVAESVACEIGRPDPVEIKWPNDVLVDGRKLSGLLLELGSEGARVAWVVLGIGVNLNVDPARFPDEFRARATSLAGYLGRPVDRAAFARRLYERLEPVLERCAERGLAGVLPAFEPWFRMRGRRVRVEALGGAAQEGIALGIGCDGALRLGTQAGETRVLAGDVTLSKEWA
jgi:BirA family biotin operon repressor/biotin-[acetyl-CoA-carboxylase] ligase